MRTGRVAPAVIIVVAATLAVDDDAGAGKQAKARKAKQAKAANLTPAWEPLVTERGTTLRGPGGTIRVHVTDVHKVNGLRVASIRATRPGAEDTSLVSEVALGRAGVWFDALGNWHTGDRQGAPLFAIDQAPFLDRKTGRSLTVEADGTTCAAWSDPAAECEGPCYWILCWAPARGVVRLGGTLAPGGDEYVAPDRSCVLPDAPAEVQAIGADVDSVTVCTDDYPWGRRARATVCRRLDRATRRWSTVEGPGLASLVAPAPTVVTNRDGDVTLCASEDQDCPAVQLPAGVLLHLAAANPDGTMVAVVFIEGSDDAVLAAYDVSAGKELARRTLPTGTSVRALRYAGAALVLELDDRAELRDARSLKRRGDVGGKTPIEPRTPPLQVAGDLWAWASAAGDEVVFQDVRTGKVKRRVALDAAPQTAGTRAWLTRAGDDLAAVYDPLLGEDDRGGVVVIATDGTIALRSAPDRCE